MKIAAITTEYRLHSHADVIVSRWLEPRPTDPQYGWGPVRTEIASLYVAQIPENDLSASVGEKYGIPRYGSIREALTLGGEQLAVDAVLLIAEHGNYPENEYGQKLYPRKEIFDEVVAVFRESGRVVPLFFDKHFSWNPVWAHEMYWNVRDLGVPFFGGSSIPHLPLSREVDFSEARELVAGYYDSLEAYLFHSLELVQALIENRPGAAGPESIMAWRGEGVWKALDEGAFPVELLEAVVAERTPEGGVEALRALRAARDEAVCAFRIRYRDGLAVTHFWHKTLSRGWAVAGHCKRAGGMAATRAVMDGGADHFFPNFAALNRQIEDFFLSGKPPIAAERLYLTTQETAACMHALAEPAREHGARWIRLPVERELEAP